MFYLKKSDQEAIKQVCKLAPNNHNVAALKCVLIKAENGKVTLTASDYICEITRSFDADIETDLMVCVEASKFAAATASCGDCKIQFKDDLIISSGRRKFTLRTVNPDSYPSYPEMSATQKLNISSSDLIEKVNRVAFSAAKGDVRAFLNGVYLSDKITATNGHRIAWVESGLDVKAIVDIAAVNKMIDIDGDVYLSSNILSLQSDSATFKCRLIDGNYPDVTRLIEKPIHHVTANKSVIVNALKDASITAHNTSKNVLLKFGDECFIESTNEKKESSVIDFEAECDSEFEMAFNSSYLIDAINAVQSDTVNLGFSEQRLIINQDGIFEIVQMVRI